MQLALQQHFLMHAAPRLVLDVCIDTARIHRVGPQGPSDARGHDVHLGGRPPELQGLPDHLPRGAPCPRPRRLHGPSRAPAPRLLHRLLRCQGCSCGGAVVPGRSGRGAADAGGGGGGVRWPAQFPCCSYCGCGPTTAVRAVVGRAAQRCGGRGGGGGRRRCEGGDGAFEAMHQVRALIRGAAEAEQGALELVVLCSEGGQGVPGRPERATLFLEIDR